MPKRKRDSDSDSPSTGDRALDIKISRLKVRIEQGISQLKKALNLARGFERQKLGRRQKAATKEPRTLLKLREEVIVLKQLDLGVVAERQLLRRLAKVKRITENAAYEHVYGKKEMEGPKNDAEANVVGRLMNSNPVKMCLVGVVESVMEVLGLEKGPAMKEKNDKSKSERDGGSVSGRAEVTELTRAEDDEWSGSESEVEDEMSVDDDANPGSGIGSKGMFKAEHNASDIDMDEGSDFSGFSARVAASSDDVSEATSSDLDSIEENRSRTIKLESRSKTNTKISSSIGSPLPSPSESPEPTKKAKPEADARNPSSTAFLPSLMMGGYYSGSETASDIEDTHSKPRKNRRGQRARQKIAEAKFGAGAKHLAKQSGGRNAGWDLKKGAVDGKVNSNGRMRIGRPINSKAPTGANGDALGVRKKEVVKDGPMHPSWEAARKRKEQGSKISINTASGMGKKITFD